VTVSYNEAARMMDGGARVDGVPMPAEWIPWLEHYVQKHYKPEPKKKRIRPPSFKGAAATTDEREYKERFLSRVVAPQARRGEGGRVAEATSSSPGRARSRARSLVGGRRRPSSRGRYAQGAGVGVQGIPASRPSTRSCDRRR